MNDIYKIAEGLRQSIYGKSANRFINYFKAVWPIVEPKQTLELNWHHGLIAEYLEACASLEIKRLIINIPPRYTKSNLITVTFPTWMWIKNPEKRFIFSSYSQSLSTKHSVDRRAILESDFYKKGFGNIFTLATDQNVKTEFQNDKRGVMVATSMGGSVTGKGGDFVIIDDPHNPKGAESDAQRNAVIESFDRTFSTRLNDKKNGVIIVVMQRLHEADLSGHLLSQGGWEHLKIPGVSTQRTIYTYPKSRITKIREANDILHPSRESEIQIKAQKVALGVHSTSANNSSPASDRTRPLIQPAAMSSLSCL